MKKLFSIINCFTLVLIPVLFLYPINVKANTSTATKITIDNTASSNKIKYIKYSTYPGLGSTLTDATTGKSWWPKRSENCTTSATTKFKTLPWLPENNGISGYNHSGSTFLSSSDCSSRYADGGISTGAWLTADEYGGWANAGVLTGWGTATQNSIDTLASAYSASLAAVTTGNFPNTQIWGQANMDNTEHSVPMFIANSYASYAPIDGWKLFSSGTTLFRNEFTLTQAQIDNLTSVNLYAVGDDWIKIWVDGTAVAATVTSEPLVRIDSSTVNTTIKNILKAAGAGNHVIAIQVNDKARWVQGNSASNSNKAGLSYKMELNITESTPPPLVLSCTVTPQAGLSPLVVMVSITNGTGPYTLNMKDGTTLSNRSNPVYYTYGTTGGVEKSYTINVTDTATRNTKDCPAVTVKDPTDSDGGEVAP